MVAGMARNPGDLPKHSPETREAARKLLEEGKHPAEVAAVLSIPESTIRGWIAREGWLAPLTVVSKNRLARELAKATKAEAAEKWAGRWDGAREQVHSLILSALQGANLPPPKNWQELAVAVETLRKICGVQEQASGSGPATVVQIGIAPAVAPSSVVLNQ
jgi:hypothetical protein